MPGIDIFLQGALLACAPLALAALGGYVADRSGVVHVGLEGLMAVGAFAGAALQFAIGTRMPYSSVALALAAAGIAGTLFSLPFAWLLTRKHVNQVVAGIALNFLAGGVSLYACRLLFGADRTPPFRAGMRASGGIYPSLYLAIAAALAVYALVYRTPFGLRLRACGTNADAARAAGVSPSAVRVAAALIAGGLAGLAGAALVLGSGIQFSGGTVNGMGFLALAACSLGRGGMGRVLLACAGFSALSAAGVLVAGGGALPALSPDLYSLLPYLAAALAAVFAAAASPRSKKRMDP